MVEVNYIAVIVSALASMVIGYLWYGPLFGKQWRSLMGIVSEQMGSEKRSMASAYSIMALGSLVMAYVLSHIITFGSSYLMTEGIASGVAAAFWCWLGFIAPVALGFVLWEMKSWKLWFLNVGYYLVTLCAMGAILAGWK